MAQHQPRNHQSRANPQGAGTFLPILVMVMVVLFMAVVFMAAGTALFMVMMRMAAGAALFMVMFVPTGAALFVVVLMAAGTSLMMMVVMLLSCKDGKRMLYSLAQCLQFFNQRIRILCRQAKLPGGKGDIGLLHLGMGIEFGLYFGCAVGAV